MKNITVLQAFEVMKVFLDGYYKRIHSDDIGSLLDELEFLDDGGTADPAAWEYWGESVEKVLSPGYTPSKLELKKPE